MRPAAEYALAAFVLVSVTAAVLWVVLGRGPGVGVAVAAGVAWVVMAVSFALMVRFRGAGNRFLAAWIGGVLLRLLVLGITVLAVLRLDALAPAATLLALAGFFFALLLLEPVFFRRGAGD